MIDGMLSISFDPPLIGFLEKCGPNGKRTRWRNSSLDEIRMLLLDLEKMSSDQKWPPRDCLLRVSGDFLSDSLAKFGLLEPADAEGPVSAMAKVRDRVV
jgi:hypothetical protein